MALVRPPRMEAASNCFAEGAGRGAGGLRTRATPAPSCAPPKPSAPPASLFLKGTVSPHNPKTLRASAGSLFRVPFLHGVATATALRRAAAERGQTLRRDAAGPTAPADPLAATDLTGRCALIIGNEAHGVSARSGACRGRRCVDSHRGRGIAKRRHGRRHSALRGAPPEDAARREPVRYHTARCPIARQPSVRSPSACARNSLEDYIGQEHILGPGKPLRRQIERDELTSIILWGPPGVGKTTLAHLIARATKLRVHSLQRRAQRHQGNQGGDGGCRAPAPPRPPHDPLRGRNSPLQQGAAGRLPALCGARRHHPDRRHHRESVL